MTSTKKQKSANDRITFILDGNVIEISDVDPTRTVLQFLREDLGRTGTKEGCAEGDCGACTVVIAELDESGDSIDVRAINSCIQFLPTLDGKELITIESLRGNNGALHPAQKAMVDCHGSQCGFCTPGFVMSLLGLYKTNAEPSRIEIDDALAGNLCRCTGYRPIVDAAMQMYAEGGDKGDDKGANSNWLASAKGNDVGLAESRIANLKSIRRAESLCIDHDGRRFFAPRDLSELAALIAEHDQATLLAGGTDVGLWVTKQHRALDTVIYTGSVAELQTVVASKTHLEIGAAATLSSVMPMLCKHFPALEELFLRFASPPIRNAGTLGGNVANGSPIGDSMPALLVLDATLLLRKGEKQREMSLNDFYLDYQVTALNAGEFVEKIRVPLPVAGAHLQSYKVSKRFDQDISAVCGAFRVSLDGNTISDARIAFGGLAAIPKRGLECEAALLGQAFDDATLATAISALTTDFQPIADMRASGQYRMQVCQNLLKRFFLESTGGAAERVYNYGRG
jgi:xanthine dehydrogenase small subunit